MRLFLKLIILIWGFATISSCDFQVKEKEYKKLYQWDLSLEKNPKAIADSLKTINPQHLSAANRAYYHLLKTIVDDKMFHKFTNDSLIDKSINYYQVFNPEGNDYIRSLIYKGIVRTRMGIADSTVFEPLKKAEALYNTQKEQDPATGYILNYFLGELLYSSDSFELAHSYYQNALKHAKSESDTTHIFDLYLAVFWNEMAQGNLPESKIYLDSIKSVSTKKDKSHNYMLNAASTYYEFAGDIKKALEYDKQLLDFLDKNETETFDLPSLHYSISRKFSEINLLDSALIYGKKATEQTIEEGETVNYLFYDNIADIAEKKQEYALANIYKKNSFDSYMESVLDRLDTQIIELEKKYDLAKSENLVLRSKQNALIITIVFLIVALTLTGLLFLNIRRRRLAFMKLMKLKHENDRHEMETKLLREEAYKRSWLISLYSYISNRLTALQDNFDQLSRRYISSNPKIYNEMMGILESTETDLREMPKILIPDDETFSLYTGLNKKESELFNNSEKIFLMLIACKANNKQIATFMNAPVHSIRVRKSQLKKKVTEKGLKSQLIFEF